MQTRSRKPMHLRKGDTMDYSMEVSVLGDRISIGEG